MSVDDLLLEHAAVTERIWFQHVLAVLYRRLGDVNLRFIYLLAIEHFARHAGHGDILDEQISHPVPPTADASEQP
ncbi:DUF664 domain-containing protein [Rhodococcus pseudokoreensis]|uniref:DUF664 domain-containing protein n=1 Tax=Rhodococcus pseudokoreensis TaxID=2811421 RepID=A0A974WC80_9NOCA|nr:DUF664 domain-containing protein [Rhodococcus pseudokoreensis]